MRDRTAVAHLPSAGKLTSASLPSVIAGQGHQHDLHLARDGGVSRRLNLSPICDALILPLQVSDTSTVYTVPDMAELLFGGVPNPAQCAAAHALLSADRTFFKQTGRLPPAFQPRSEAAVAAIHAEEAAARQVFLPASFKLYHFN